MGQRYTLFFTAREGREDDLRWALYDRKISPDLRDPDTKQTALHLAAAKGRVGCVQLLIEAGKRIRLLYIACHAGCNPLSLDQHQISPF